MKKIRIKEVVTYNGHKVKGNGKLDLSFKANYDELVNSIQVLQMLNNDIKIKAKISGTPAYDLGVFRIARVQVNGDGESVLNLTTLTDYAEVNNISQLVGVDMCQVLMEADIEEEE